MSSDGPIWIDPPAYWQATSGMTSVEIEELLDRIMELKQKGDIESLQRYSFVVGVGYPFQPRKIAQPQTAI